MGERRREAYLSLKDYNSQKFMNQPQNNKEANRPGSKTKILIATHSAALHSGL